MPSFSFEVGYMTANAPEDLDRLFGEGINAGNVEAVLALYEPDAVLVRQDGTHAVGLDQNPRPAERPRHRECPTPP